MNERTWWSTDLDLYGALIYGIARLDLVKNTTRHQLASWEFTPQKFKGRTLRRVVCRIREPANPLIDSMSCSRYQPKRVFYKCVVVPPWYERLLHNRVHIHGLK